MRGWATAAAESCSIRFLQSCALSASSALASIRTVPVKSKVQPLLRTDWKSWLHFVWGWLWATRTPTFALCASESSSEMPFRSASAPSPFSATSKSCEDPARDPLVNDTTRSFARACRWACTVLWYFSGGISVRTLSCASACSTRSRRGMLGAWSSVMTRTAVLPGPTSRVTGRRKVLSSFRVRTLGKVLFGPMAKWRDSPLSTSDGSPASEWRTAHSP
mmetsp:Transcript_74532/g.131712  ORF Transcript_74532/g.131712 Transcript_74532/m.131712 type:complete len:219 (+) Transcript_74532:257-913(+)